jgi:hypothetical protein
MHRYITLLLAVVAALSAAPPGARAQSGGEPRRREMPREAEARARRERLLLRFDSLRFEFERKRLDDAERDKLAEEMHRTVVALEESLDDIMLGRMASTRAQMEAMRDRTGDGPRIAIVRTPGGRGPMPRGYLGLSFDGPNIDEIRGGERVIRFLEYPRITLVEPSSPAERAGIVEGDTLLAFDGNDVRAREISLTKLLVPDQRIVVRVRREGNPRDFRVRVDEAPAYVMSRRAPMAIAGTPVRVYTGDDLPRRAPLPAEVSLPRTPAPPAMATSVWIFNEGVGGAKLETVSEGLGRALGTKSGILVLRVSPGTPAYESGLRDGDVILRALGRDVSNVRELRSIVADGDRDDGVRLVVLRDRKKRDLTLRW